MLRGITAEQFLTWSAFDAIEPIGDTREDLRMSYLATLFVNSKRDPKKHAEPYKLEALYSHFIKQVEEVTGIEQGPEEQKKSWQMIKAALLNHAFAAAAAQKAHAARMKRATSIRAKP